MSTLGDGNMSIMAMGNNRNHFINIKIPLDGVLTQANRNLLGGRGRDVAVLPG